MSKRTNRTIGAAALMLALGLAASPASAQEATERYIPLGQSPGLSGVVTFIGEVTEADPVARSITVRADAESRTVVVPETADIWLDRSARREANTRGGFSDLQVGRTVEVMYLDPAARQGVDWIKVAIGG